MTSTMAPFCLSLSRDSNVLKYQSMTCWRAFWESAASAAIGSSMIMISPPRPVRAPSTEVASRNPFRVVATSVWEFFIVEIRMAEPLAVLESLRAQLGAEPHLFKLVRDCA